MRKGMSLKHTVLVLVPMLAAVGAVAIFTNLPKSDDYFLEGAVEIASSTCYAQASGTVESVPVKTGQWVQRGDVLAVIDDSAVEDQVAQLQQVMEIKRAQVQQLRTPPDAQALLASRRVAQSMVTLWQETLEQAQRTLATAEQSLLDQQVLFDAGVIAKAELQQYEQAVELAQSQLNTTQAQLSAAKDGVDAIQLPGVDKQAVTAAEEELELTLLQLEQAEAGRARYSIRAVTDGVVISTALDAGATVVAGQSAFKLSNGNLQYFVFYLPQEYLSQVAFGDELVLSLQGSREEAAHAVVDYIDWQAVYPPDDYENDGNRNQRSVKMKAVLTDGGPFAVGQTLFLRLDTVQD